MFTFDVPRHIPTWAGLCYGQVRAESYREVRSNRAVARIISTEVQEISRPRDEGEGGVLGQGQRAPPSPAAGYGGAM